MELLWLKSMNKNTSVSCWTPSCLLRYHENRYNFIDTPSNECPCNHGIEDTNHFLFSCSSYDIQRATLLNTVIEIIRKYNLND